MKLACSSSAFDEQLRTERLTQLEWIDVCAHDLDADGIVLDTRHFPRVDADYFAQIKKMAVDLGLTVAALRDDAFLTDEEADMERTVSAAVALGAPLLSAPLPAETAASWAQVQARLGAATGTAKRLNVTLAIRNAPGTFAASVHDLKRVSKEADSAWLRYGPDFDALDATSEPQQLLAKTVLAWSNLSSEQQRTAQTLRAFRGFIVPDAPGGDATLDHMKNAFRRWRAASVADRT